MKCPKCGSEYEGVSCPQCNGPQIIINDSDYLRRKKEWEETGKILGVKVRKDTDNEEKKVEEEKKDELPDFSKINIYIQKAKNIFKVIKDKALNANIKEQKQGKNSSNKNSSNKNASNRNASNRNSSGRNSSGRNSHRRKIDLSFVKKHWLRISILLVIVLVGITAGKDLYKLAKRFSMTMYLVSDDGRICTAGSDEIKLVANVKDVIFTIDGESFYDQELPSQISEGSVIYSYASDGGKYFVAEAYDGVSTYSLYIWNSDGIKKVSEGATEKDVKYISNKGRLLFTDITYLYEGAVSNIALYSYDPADADSSAATAAETSSKTSNTSDVSSKAGSTASIGNGLTLIEQNIRSEYLYLNNDTLVYLNSENRLYTINFAKMSDRTLVGEGIKDIYGIAEDNDNFYSNSSSVVKPSQRRESFIYSMSGEFYYYSISDKESTYLFKSQYSGVDIIYEKSQDNIYCISTSGVSYGKFDSESGAELTTIDTIKSISDKSYFADDSTLLYINSSGELISVYKGTKTTLRSGVSSNSLNPVRNSGGITYIAGGAQYFRSSFTATEVKLSDMAAGTDTSQTLEHRGKIYFLDAEKKLYYCSLKGKDLNNIGTVESFWIK